MEIKTKNIEFPNKEAQDKINKIALAFLILLITIVIGISTIACFIVAGLSKQDEFSGSIECNAEDINLKNITYHTTDMQWINSTTYSNKLINESIDNLPLPKNLHCSGQLSVKTNKWILSDMMSKGYYIGW